MKKEKAFSPLWASLVAFSALIFAVGEFWFQFRISRSSETLAAWHNIGGCGASGGGAAAGAGKWIGRSVSGGLVDLEMLGNRTIGGDYVHTTTGLSLTGHRPSWPSYTASLSMGLKSSVYEYEGYKTASDPTSRIVRQVGGFSDMGLGINRMLGNENEHSLGLSFGLPTGRHNIKRLHRKLPTVDDVRWVNPFAQPGSGLYSAGMSYEFTRDRDWGLMVFGGSYSASFAWDNQGCRDALHVRAGGSTVNEDVAYCQDAAPEALTWKLWELKHQPWDLPWFGQKSGGPSNWGNSYGAPGTGATGADAVSLYAHVGRKDEHSSLSGGLTMNLPLAPTYYWENGPIGSDSKVATRMRVYDITLKLSMGLEISNPNFPVFLAVGIPWALDDVLDRGRWVNPQNYVGTVGLRGTFF